MCKSIMARLVDSSDYVRLAKVRSNHSRKIGFFDHKAAHLLASAARDEKRKTISDHDWTDVPALDHHDLRWLELSNKGVSRKKRNRKYFPFNSKGCHTKRIRAQLGIGLYDD
mmetsp:Transcript_11859/g.17410  ORF Transcript_11859/g.17410 Transcript_11859/m.17410 type:complete len:112 (+) Transcript_11859:174-509(+)